jgi:hypothetical protein
MRVTFLSGYLLRVFSLKSLQFLSWLLGMPIPWHPRIQHRTHDSQKRLLILNHVRAHPRLQTGTLQSRHATKILDSSLFLLCFCFS